MKKLFLIAALAFFALDGKSQNFASFPAFQTWPLTWDHDAPPNQWSYDLYSGTNKIATLTTNQFTLLGVTNGVATYRATVPALLLGTNILTLIATDGTIRSAPSLPLTATGELPPPRNLRP